jgi:hypothetical protein
MTVLVRFGLSTFGSGNHEINLPAAATGAQRPLALVGDRRHGAVDLARTLETIGRTRAAAALPSVIAGPLYFVRAACACPQRTPFTPPEPMSASRHSERPAFPKALRRAY